MFFRCLSLFYCTRDKKNQLEASEETEAETCPCISCPCFYSVASLAFLSQINLSFLLPSFSFVFFCFSLTSTRTYIQSRPGLIQELVYLPTGRLGREHSDSVLCREKRLSKKAPPATFLLLYPYISYHLTSISPLVTFASGQGKVCHADLLRQGCILWQSVSRVPVELPGMPPRGGGIAQLPVSPCSWWLLCRGHLEEKSLEV